MESKNKIEGKFEAFINKIVELKFVEEIPTKCPYCSKTFTITVPIDSIAKTVNEFKIFVKNMLYLAKEELEETLKEIENHPDFDWYHCWIIQKLREKWIKKWFGEK